MSDIETNIAKIAAEYKTTPSKIRKGIGTGLDAIADYGVRQEKAFVQSKAKNGGRNLKGSISSIKTGEYSRAFGPMIDHIYPLIFEKGRGPIFPRGDGTGLSHNVSYLGVHVGAVALKINVGNGVIFRKSAGPAAPRPYIEPTHQALNKMGTPMMEKHLNDVLK